MDCRSWRPTPGRGTLIKPQAWRTAPSISRELTRSIPGACGRLPNDAPQRFVVSYTYTLPIFKLTHRWKMLTDDWNLAGIYTLQHGTPVPVFDLLSTSLTCDLSVSFYACPDRADRTSAPIGITDPERLRTSSISIQRLSRSGRRKRHRTASRNPLYGPGINYGTWRWRRGSTSASRSFSNCDWKPTTLSTAQTLPTLPLRVSARSVSPLTGGFGQFSPTKTLTTIGEGRAVQLGAKFSSEVGSSIARKGVPIPGAPFFHRVAHVAGRQELFLVNSERPPVRKIPYIATGNCPHPVNCSIRSQWKLKTLRRGIAARFYLRFCPQESHFV